MTVGHDVERLLQRGGGALTMRDALAVGIPASRMRRLVRSGLLTRVGRGAYVSTAALGGDPWRAHALRARGFAQANQDAWLAGWSGIALHQLRQVGRPPARPRAVRPSVSGSRTVVTSYGVIRHVQLPEAFRTVVDHTPVVAPAWLTVDLARTVSRPTALIVTDGALAAGVTKSELVKAYSAMQNWPGAMRAAWAIEHGDGRSESVLETLGRWACIRNRLPVPESNVWVGVGGPIFRVDHLWPWHWVVAEGDGAKKYQTDDPAAVVRKEKERQWYLENELGLRVVRYGWNLAARQPQELAARFASVLAAHPPRSEPLSWWPSQHELAA